MFELFETFITIYETKASQLPQIIYLLHNLP